jgi:hypothetical protein
MLATVGFPSIGLQSFTPKLAEERTTSRASAADDAHYFQISLPAQ